MLTPVLLTISAVVLPGLLSSPTRDCQFGPLGDPAADARALARFERAVNDYAGLHRRLVRGWPPMWFISDLEQVEEAAREFRAMLRDARPQAAQGGFFTPGIAEILRFRLARALRERSIDLQALTAPVDEAETDGWWTPVVNERLPWNGLGTLQPLLETLPPLPFELEYRLIGRDLVLLDVRANMVVDVLDLAVPTVRYLDSD